MWFSVALLSCQHLVLSVFWMLASLIGMKWYQPVLICISLPNDIWCWASTNMLICHLSSLVSCLSRPFLIFNHVLFSYCWVLRFLCTFWTTLFFFNQICFSKLFSIHLWLVLFSFQCCCYCFFFFFPEQVLIWMKYVFSL